MDKEKLGAKREEFNVEIRRTHHQKMLRARREQVQVNSTDCQLENAVLAAENAEQEDRQPMLINLVNLLGDDDVFAGMKSRPDMIDQWCNRLLALLVRRALNTSQVGESMVALAGLSNLTGDTNFNEVRSLREVMLFLQDFHKSRGQLYEAEQQQVQWIYSNILLKNIELTGEEISSILCSLGDAQLYSLDDSGNQRLRENVVKSLDHLLRQNQSLIHSHRQYIKDIVRRLVHLLTVEDHASSTFILRIFRGIICHDPQLFSLRDQEQLIDKCIQLLNAKSTGLKTQAYRVMCHLAENASNSRFILAHHISTLVMMLRIEEMRLKERILELLNVVTEQQHHEDVVQEILQKSNLFMVLLSNLECHCFDVQVRALDMLIRCAYYSKNQATNMSLIRQYSTSSLPLALEHLRIRYEMVRDSEQHESLLRKVDQLLEWINQSSQTRDDA